MRDIDLVIQQAQALEIGERCTLTFLDIDSRPYTLKVTKVADLEQRGYWHPDGGSWSSMGGEGYVPCYVLPAKPYRKVRARAYKIGYSVIDVRPGWEAASDD